MTTTTDQLDPATIHLTRHVVDRYMERRSWPTTNPLARGRAEDTIRGLLARCVDQYPPVFLRPHLGPSRRFTTGDLAFVVAADLSAVITFYVLRRGR